MGHLQILQMPHIDAEISCIVAYCVWSLFNCTHAFYGKRLIKIQVSLPQGVHIRCMCFFVLPDAPDGKIHSRSNPDGTCHKYRKALCFGESRFSF